MKTMNLKHTFAALLCMAACAGLAACDSDTIETEGGKLPDRETLKNAYVSLRSAGSAQKQVAISFTEGATIPVSNKFYCFQTREAENSFSVTAAVDAEKVDEWNKAHDTNFALFPGTATISDEGRMTIETGTRRSALISVSISPVGVAGGTYLLPVSISAENMEFAPENRTLYYLVSVRTPYKDDYPVDTELGLSVVYLNTKEYQPLLVDAVTAEKWDMLETFDIEWTHSYFNIVNLRTVQIGLDETSGRAMLLLNSDIRWVLDQADKYIRPLQDKGRKVCISIEGNGSGLGFCNLTDAQIADFVSQVKAVVDNYPIDGINLWDRNAGYGKEGMPAMNTTSYPKLIKALREALGNDKLLTVTDHKEPTEYFWDTEATGGIAVGEYIDYAWSGYMSNSEGINIVDPWDQGGNYVSTKYPRKPIAGFTREKYGIVGIPFRAVNDDDFDQAMQEQTDLMSWVLDGKQTNNILVFNDLITNTQDEYEGVAQTTVGNAWGNFFQGAVFMEYMLTPSVTLSHPDEMAKKYNGFKKDWE